MIIAILPYLALGTALIVLLIEYNIQKQIEKLKEKRKEQWINFFEKRK